MKAIIEKPLSYCNVPLVIYIYVAILNRITQSNNEEELRETMGLLSIECTGTFNSILITASVPTICGSVRRKAVNVLFLSNSKILYIMKKQLINFFHGRFGKKVLKTKYREWWVRFWYGIGAIICTFLFFGMIQFLSWISDLINYVF